MKISYKWLQDYFKNKLPNPEKLAEEISLKSYEVEAVEGDILDIDVLPNRSHDSLSYIGVAKDIAVILDEELNLPKVEYEKNKDQKTSDFISLEVLDPNLVLRAMKRVVLDVKVGNSPDWLKEKLSSIGQRSINNIVDITNFVMWETGQPVHAFDLDKIKDGKITIRGAKEGEKITALDEIEYELKEGMLVISDTEKALDIAGIKGGLASGIDENTKRVVLSVCNFNPTWIRKTSRALNLLTDASKRFEQGITPYLAEVAMERLSQLVSELAEGNVLEDIVDSYPKEKIRTTAPYKIGVSLSEINKVLGSDMKEKDVEEVLDRFSKYAGFKWEKVNPREKVLEEAKKYEGVPYKYGASITYDSPNYFDCSSFSNYLYIQAGIVMPRMVQDQYAYSFEIEGDPASGDMVFSSTDSDGEVEMVERLGAGQARQTKQTVDFIQGIKFETSVDHVGIYLGDNKVMHASPKRHKNKVVIEKIDESPTFQKVVGYRRSIKDNEERFVVEIPPERLDLRAGPGFMISGIKEDLIEEIGRVYGYENIKSVLPNEGTAKVNKTFYYIEKLKDLLVNESFSEVITYSFQNKGKVKLANPLASDKKYLRESLYDGLSQALELNKKNAPALGLDEIKIFEIGNVFEKDREYLSLGVAVSGKTNLTEINEKIQDILGEAKSEIKDKILMMEIDEENLPEINSYDGLDFDIDKEEKFKEISPYPFVLRDIALWVPGEIESQKVQEIIKGDGGELLKNVRLFDEYKKANKVSYAFHLVFQSNEKTLSDEEVNEIMKKVENNLSQNGWEIR